MMSLAVIQQWWESAGSRIIWFSAVVAAMGLLSRTKAVRWLWGTVVTGPLSRWQTTVIAAVVDEKVSLPNGGSSLRDSVDELVVAQTTLTNQQSVLLEWTAEQAERQSEWAEYVGGEFAQVHERIDRLCDEVGRMKQRKGVA